MSVDIATIGLEVDSTKVRDGKRALDDFASAGDKVEGSTKRAITATQAYDMAVSRSKDTIKSAEDATLRFIAQLERQVTLHGKSAAEALRYDSALLGATRTQRDHIESLIKQAEAQEKSIQKSATLMDTMKSMAAAIGLVGLAWKAYDYAKDAALLNARYETLGVSMTVVGKNAGYTAEQMEDAARGMQKMGISMIESRQQAMRLVQAHINLADSQKLARIAQDAAVIGNMNSSEAFAAMIHGIQTGQTEVLRTIGLNISMENSYKLMADQLHKNKDALTQNEKTQAILNAVMKAGADISGTYEAAMDTAGKQLNSMKRYSEDLQVKQGELFNESLTVAVMAYTKNLKDANGELDHMAANKEIDKWGEDLSDVLVALADNANNAYQALKILGLTSAMVAAMGNTTPMDSEGRSAIMEAYKKDVDATFAAEDRFSKALAERRKAKADHNAKEKALDDERLENARHAQAAYAKMLNDGLISQKQYLAAAAAVSQAYSGDNHQYKDTPTTTTHSENKRSEYQNIIEAAKERVAVLKLEEATAGKLTEAEKTLAKMEAELLSGKKMGTEADRKRAEAALNAQMAEEKKILISKESAKLENEQLQFHKARADAIGKEADAIVADTQKMRDQNVELVNGKQALESLRESRIDATMETLQYTLATIDATGQCTAESEAIRDKIAALKDQKKALGEQVTAIAIHRQQEEWKKFTDQIEQSLTDALMAGFNSGKSFGQSFIDSLKHSLETAALKIVVQAIVSPVMGAMGQASGLTGAVGSGGNMLSGMSSLGSAFGSSAGQALIGLSNATGIESIGDFGASMIAGEGVGGAIATAAPWVAGAAVIADALGLFGKRGGPQSGQYGSIGSGGYSSSFTMSGGDSLGNQALASSAYGQAAALYAMAGKDASGLSINQGYKLDPKGTAAGLAYRDIVVNGKAITGGNFDGNNGAQWTGSHDDAAGAANYLGKLGNSEILALVKAIGDPALEATVGKLAANFTDLNKAIGQYATAQAQQKALSFALMSQDEQKAAALRDAHAALESTFGSLGIGIPATAEAFRKIVDSLDLTTQAGQSELQALDGVGKAFLLVAASASTAAEQLIDLAGKRSREIQIMQLQGDSAGALAAQRSDELAKLDPVNAKLQQQIYDLTDQQTAAAAAAEAMRNAAAAQKYYTSAVKETASVINLFGAEHFKTQNEYMLYLSQAQRSGIDTSRIAGSPANQASFFQPAKPSADIAGSINSQAAATAKVAASVTAISNATAQNTAAINALSSFLRRLSPDGSSITTKAA